MRNSKSSGFGSVERTHMRFLRSHHSSRDATEPFRIDEEQVSIESFEELVFVVEEEAERIGGRRYRAPC